MSSQEDKAKHSKRLHSDESYIARQGKLAKAYGITVKEPHRFHKVNCLTCGNSNCVMCGNPRKMFKEKTIQERSFEQVPTTLANYEEELDDEITIRL